jgi:hypothetical protein
MATDVRIQPLFDDPKEMQKYIESRGFDEFLRFTGYSDHCEVTFPTAECARNFRDSFDGKTIRGHVIEVRVLRPAGQPRTRRPPGMRSRTIAVSGYPPGLLTDRNLWDHFCRLGFVRQIECCGSTGYIQFDTEDDALNAFNDMDDAVIRDSVVRVDVVPDRTLNLPHLVIPLGVEEREEAKVPIRPRNQPPPRPPPPKGFDAGFRPRKPKDFEKPSARPRDRHEEPKCRNYERG